MTYVNTYIQDYQASNITTESLDVNTLEADLIQGVLQGTVIDSQSRVLINHEASQIFAPNGFFGDLTGNADTVTNGVYTIGDQNISGIKTFQNQAVFNQSVNVNVLKNKSGYTGISFSDEGSGTPTTTIHGDLVILNSNVTSIQTNDLEVNDHRILLGNGNETSSPLSGSGIVIDGGQGTDIEFVFNSNQRMGLNYGLDIENGNLNVLDGNASVSGSIASNSLLVATSIESSSVKANILKSDDSVMYNGSNDSINVTSIVATTLSGDLTGNITGQVSDISNHTTDDLAEGSTNLYFTDTRAKNAISAGLGVNYDPATGVISLDQSLSPADNVQFQRVFVREGAGVGVDLVSQTNNASLRFHTSNGQTGIISTTNGNAPVQVYSSLLWARAINGGTGNFTADGDATIGGTSTVTGNSSVGGDLDVAGAITSPTITALQNSQSSGNAVLQAELDATQAGAGLNADGSYSANTGANYIQASSSLQDADNDLDTALKAEEASRQSADTTLQANIDSEEASRIAGDASTLSSANSYTDTAVANLVDSAPATLDTLNELAGALADDPNFATTVTNSIATKLAIADFDATFDTRLATKTTTDLTEGANLYYLDSRARASISVSGSLAYNANTGEISYTERTEGELNTISNTWLATKTTADLAEGANRYFTTARARESISATGDLSYDNATGVLSFTERTDEEVQSLADGQIAVASIGDLSDIDLSANANGKILKYNSVSGNFECVIDEDNFANNSTDQLAEGSSNLYYTDARARASISVSGSLSYDNVNGIISFTQRTDTQVRTLANEQIALQVGSNLDLSQKSTSDLSEGSNLYYTDARARLSISVTGDLSYDNATGVISFTERTDSEVNALADARIAAASLGDMSDVDLSGIQTGQILKWNGSKLAPGTDQEDLSNNSTDDLSEGSSNLYYTDARVDAYLSANGYATESYVNSADTTLQSNIDTVASDLSTEESTRAAADATLQSNIDSEASTRASADATLQGNINIVAANLATEIAATDAEVSALQSADTAEATARAAADTTLQSNIDSEEAARILADNTLQSNIDTEEAARIAGDAATLSSAQSYTDTAVANLVDSAPATLDTLNELAAALADDPNFATTITNQIASVQADVNQNEADADAAIALKADIASPTFTGVVSASTVDISGELTTGDITIDAGGDDAKLKFVLETNGGADKGGIVWTRDSGGADVGAIKYVRSQDSIHFYTNGTTTADVTINAAGKLIANNGIEGSLLGTVSDISNHDTDALTEGTSNLYYTDARSRGAISAGGDLSYNSTTGVISFTERTDAEVNTLADARIAAASVTDLSDVDQSLATTDAVTFEKLTINQSGTDYGMVINQNHANAGLHVDATSNGITIASADTTFGGVMFRAFNGNSVGVTVGTDGNTTFSGDVTAQGTILLSGVPTATGHAVPKSYVDAIGNDVDDLVTLSGVAAGSLNLGTFTGTTIQDNINVKQALQQLETALEGNSSPSSTDDLSEGTTNLYYTDGRSRSAISVSGDLSYNSSTGVISFTERTDAEVNSLADARIATASLGDLNNVTETALAEGDILRYNKTSGEWENVIIEGTTNIEVEYTPGSNTLTVKHGTSHFSKTYDNADNGTATNDLPITRAEVILDIAGTATNDVYLNIPQGSEGQELVLIIDSAFSSIYNIYLNDSGSASNATNMYGTFSLGAYNRTAVLRYCSSLGLWTFVGGDAYVTYT